MLRLNVRRLEAQIVAGLVGTEASPERRVAYLSHDDLDEFISLMQVKTCTYQESAQQNDLWCHAASPTDPTAVTQIGLHFVAPTTPALCLSCTLPDTDHVCSHLSHPSVVGIAAGNVAVAARRLSGGLCALDRPEVANPSLCRAGGHSCWQRHADLATERELEPTSPRSLHYALDHLDVAWRAGFATRERIFQPKSAETLAGLAEPCTSRAELGQRLNELDTVLHWLSVPDDAGVTQDPSARSLGRLRAFLDAKLPGLGVGAEDLDTVRNALADLRRVNDARVALEHPGDARTSASEAFRVLGLAYPPADWGSAWHRVRAVTVTALRAIGDVLARIS